MKTISNQESKQVGICVGNSPEPGLVELTEDQLDSVDGALAPVAVGAVAGAFGGALSYGLGAGSSATVGGYVAAGVFGFVGGALAGVGGLTAGLGGASIGALGGWGGNVRRNEDQRPETRVSTARRLDGGKRSTPSNQANRIVDLIATRIRIQRRTAYKFDFVCAVETGRGQESSDVQLASGEILTGM